MEKRLEILFIIFYELVQSFYFAWGFLSFTEVNLNLDPFCQWLFDHIIAEFNFSLATDKTFCHLWDNPFPAI